jgi:hypothetical protein
VRVDEAGEDVLAGGIDHFRVRRDLEVWSDARDGFVFDEYVCLVSGVSGYDFAIFDLQGHG